MYLQSFPILKRGHRGHVHVVVAFTTTYANAQLENSKYLLIISPIKQKKRKYSLPILKITFQKQIDVPLNWGKKIIVYCMPKHFPIS
jgi:hypothetical protein